MRLAVDQYLGEAPRKSARDLGQNMAQIAQNARLLTDDLEAWRQFVSETVLPAFTPSAAVKTIYKLKDVWLQFKEQVDVARGLIPGDSNYFTFLTGPALYTEPRYTTYAMATGGAAPYPFETRPLGMPAPTTPPTLVLGVSSDPTTFSVDLTDDCSDMAANWQFSPGQQVGETTSIARQTPAYGNPVPGLEVTAANNETIPAYAVRDFGIAGASVATIVVECQAVDLGGSDSFVLPVLFGVDGFGAGCRIVVHGQLAVDLTLSIAKAGAFTDGPGANLASNTSATMPAVGTWYRIEATRTAKEDGTATIVAKLFSGATELASVTTTNNFESGDFCGALQAKGDDVLISAFDNFHVTASGSLNVTVVNTATSYVYTFVGANDWESAPSPASATVLRPDGVSVTVTTPTTTPYDPLYGIDTKRIYRSVSGASGDAFYLLDEIPLATADYVDELDDSAITNPGTLLESTDWDLPHPDMEGIIALPNGIMAGFFLNQLCLSAVARPHAWPIKFRLPTDTRIVAIRNIDNTIVVATEGALYTATGNDPASYTMSAPGEVQACVSKVGMTYIDGYGVVYPSPDGFQVCAGSAGNVRNATELIFEKHQWAALNPSSIRSAVHDGILFFWFDGPNPDIGYALDTKQGGFGLIRLSHHAIAAHVDPLLDALFVILDSVSEPVEALLPIASTAPTPTALTIFKFDAHATNRVRFLWRGRLNLMPQDTTMQWARVQAVEYSNLVLRVYGDGVLIFTKRITDDRPFRLFHGGKAYKTYEAELVGTSTAQPVQLVQDISEVA